MSDPAPERPQPRYGEYASPEEQRARIRGGAPEEIVPPVDPVAPASGPAAVPAPAGAAAPGARVRLGDVVATALLLGYGLTNVLSQVRLAFDPFAFADVLTAVYGTTVTVTDPGALRAWMAAAAVVAALGWLVTASFCVRRLRRRQWAWWIALVAGVVVSLLAAVFVMIAMFGDPGVRDALFAVAAR